MALLFMHTFKVVSLVLVTLLVLRLGSWALLWLLSRLFHRHSVVLRLAANLLGLAAFVAFLVIDRLPGEILDLQAFVFGLVVFALFFAADCKWLPRIISGRPVSR